jgi:hypothetical protein
MCPLSWKFVDYSFIFLDGATSLREDEGDISI